MLPGRLGVRFALEAIFIVLLAVGAGLADLRPAFIVLVMAAAWLLVALVELTAERIARSPVSYLLPETEPEPEEEAAVERVFAPPVEERTVVAPPPEIEDTQEPVAERAPEPEPVVAAEAAPLEAEAELALEGDAEGESLEPSPRRRLAELFRRPQRDTAPKPEPEPRPLPEPEAEAVSEPEPEEAEAVGPGRFRGLFRRREQELEPMPEPPPRHVKLLPRRSAPEPSPASTEVAELFESGEEGADAEETAG